MQFSKLIFLLFMPEKLCGFWNLEDFRSADFRLSTIHTFRAYMYGLTDFQRSIENLFLFISKPLLTSCDVHLSEER